jgi:prepilin peptidase CpaA
MCIEWFVLAACPLLLTAAWRDLATRTIPNAISVLLIAAGLFFRGAEGLLALAHSGAAALILFAVLLFLFSRGYLGGGDVKIMTALASGLPVRDSYCFVVATALAGGILGLVYIALSRTLPATRRQRRGNALSRVLAVESWRIRRGGPLPYGVAIAAGGVFVLLHNGSL